MTPRNDHLMPLPAVRQLRRIRTFYATAALLWAVLAAGEGWTRPGSRPMWVSVLLLVLFTGLLSVTSLWLRRHRTAEAALTDARTARASKRAMPRARLVPRLRTMGAGPAADR
ncbi:hypothetical protein [Streptomyces sp. MB09-02B]|uniref:hypothetical protein n=1 Tax=Streptomyces sp. MB09-02B TaxID=3028667 RepID=UPI0029AC06C0|nr:hypothetical protein [Streptomyces sp. MB09-02B]MDX3642205.1 hypothetical protein [Streptomyces sp. MB09-02B]